MERIELSGSNMKLRVVLTVVFLLLGVGLIAFALVRALTPQAGWVTIEASSGEGATEADEFVFLYRLEEKTAKAENTAVTALYSRLCRTAFQLFHTKAAFDGVNNICSINAHPNEVLTVDPGLYDALATVQASGSRTFYLGPVVSRYGGVFTCQDDLQLVDFDPFLNEDVRRDYLEYAAWARDPQSVDVELLGDCQVRLNVSQEYLAYAQQEGIDTFIDFGWMKNAFVADYVADGLTDAGFTKGVLSSYDGFARCLDNSGGSFSLQLYDRREEGVYPAAVLQYEGPMSIASFRDYPMTDMDGLRFYKLSGGEVRTAYLDVADGLCKSAVHDLTCLSPSLTCAELALAAAPVFIAEELREEALVELAEHGIQSIWCDNFRVLYTGAEPALADLYAGDGKKYAVSPVGA